MYQTIKMLQCCMIVINFRIHTNKTFFYNKKIESEKHFF